MERIRQIEGRLAELPPGTENDKERLKLLAELAYRNVKVDIAKAREMAERLKEMAEA